MGEASNTVYACDGCKLYYCANCGEISECPKCGQVFCNDCFTDEDTHECQAEVAGRGDESSGAEPGRGDD